MPIFFRSTVSGGHEVPINYPTFHVSVGSGKMMLCTLYKAILFVLLSLHIILLTYWSSDPLND